MWWLHTKLFVQIDCLFGLRLIELKGMADRIIGVRRKLVESLEKEGMMEIVI